MVYNKINKMSTTIHFRDYNPKQMILFPQRLDKDIAENDPVRVVDRQIKDRSATNNRKQLLTTLGRGRLSGGGARERPQERSAAKTSNTQKKRPKSP